MTNDIDTQWAWSQIEAMADGSLAAKDRQRMRGAMAADPHLADAVERARELRRALRGLGGSPVPASLRERLLRIAADAGGRGEPNRRPPAYSMPLWSWGSAASAAMAIAAVLILATRPQAPAVDERAAALREFQVAMAYLQHSYAVAGEQVRRATERRLREALDFGGAERGVNGEDINGE